MTAATAAHPSPGAVRRAAILRALDESGPAAARALAAALRLSEQQARESLAWLEDASLVTHQAGPSASGRGLAYTWSITDEGRERRQGCAPWAADPCFQAIAGAAAGRPAETHEIQCLLGELYGGSCPLPLVEDGLRWLAEEGHAVIAPAGRGRWALTPLGRAAVAVSDDEDAPVWLRVRIAQDREAGGPGMSAELADAILACAGPGAPPDARPGERRLSWSVIDHGFSEREIGWEHDPASGQWVFRVRVMDGGQWRLARETRTADPVMLAWQALDAAEPDGPAPLLADDVFVAISGAAGPVAGESLQERLADSGGPWTPGDLRDALLWLSGQRPRVITQGVGGWQLAPAGHAVEAMPEREWAPLGLCLALAGDRRHGVDGMSARTAAALAACADAGSLNAPWPGEVRRRWEATDGPRKIAWERDAASSGEEWNVTVSTAQPAGTWAIVREARAPGITELARQIRQFPAQAAALGPRVPVTEALDPDRQAGHQATDAAGAARPRPGGTERRQPRRSPSRRERRAKGRRR